MIKSCFCSFAADTAQVKCDAAIEEKFAEIALRIKRSLGMEEHVGKVDVLRHHKQGVAVNSWSMVMWSKFVPVLVGTVLRDGCKTILIVLDRSSRQPVVSYHWFDMMDYEEDCSPLLPPPSWAVPHFLEISQAE